MEIMGKEKLSSLRKKLKDEIIKRRAGDNVSSYAVMFEDGYWRLQVDDVCFYRSRYERCYDEKNTNTRNIKELVFSLIPGVKKGPKYKFVNYILTRSVFKDLFLTKNVQAAWRYGVKMDISANYSQVVAAMIAVRESWEFPSIAETWEWLCKNGVNEHAAWICAHAAGTYEKGFIKRGGDAHSSFGLLYINEMKALINEGLFDDGGLSLENGATSYKIFIATRSYDKGEGKELKTLLFKGSKQITKGWSDYEYISKKGFLANVKEVEKEILS